MSEVTAQELKNLIAHLKPRLAPCKTQRCGDHIEFVVGIGDNETAFITMTREAYDVLMAGCE